LQAMSSTNQHRPSAGPATTSLFAGATAQAATSQNALPAPTTTFPESSVSTEVARASHSSASPDSTATTTATTMVTIFLMGAMQFEVDASSLQNLWSQAGLASFKTALEAVLNLPVKVVAVCLARDTVSGRCPPSSDGGGGRMLSSGEVMHIDFGVDTSASSAANVAEAALQLRRIEQGNTTALSQVAMEVESAFESQGVVLSGLKALPAPPLDPGTFLPVGETHSTSRTLTGSGVPFNGPLPPETTGVQIQTDTHSLLVVVVVGTSSAACLIVASLCGVGWLLKRRRQFHRFDDNLDAFHDPSLERTEHFGTL